MAINQKDFSTLVSDQVSAIQGVCADIVDFVIGSIMLSLLESNAAIGIWLQQMVLNLLATARAATCAGSDLDSWAADYGFYRDAAVAGTGTVTFSRFTPTLQAVIPIGALVASTDGSQQFQVTTDTSNAAYNAAQNGYVLAAGTASVSVPVQATVAGAANNVVAGQITVIVQPISGVDTVTNAAAIVNGADAETDTAMRARFVSWVSSLSKATLSAIEYAVNSLGPNYASKVMENQNYDGSANLGFFSVIVDDGTGAPSNTVLSNAFNAIDAVRPLTSTFNVYAPAIVSATVSMTIIVGQGYDHPTVQSAVQAAVQSYINSLTLGQTLLWSKLAQVAFNASTGVADVQNVLLNGGAVNLTATNKQVIKYQAVTVTIGNQGD